MGKTHVTNTTITEFSIHAVLQFSNSSQRDNYCVQAHTKRPQRIYSLVVFFLRLLAMLMMTEMERSGIEVSSALHAIQLQIRTQGMTEMKRSVIEVSSALARNTGETEKLNGIQY